MRLFEREEFKKMPIAFGGAAIGGNGGGYVLGDVQEKQATDLLLRAFDLGIVVFDSAPIYGFGESERILGNTFKQLREKVFLISKSGVSWHDNKRVNMTNDPKITLKMLEGSLKSFDSDYIDLYMIHWPDEKIDIRYPLEVLKKEQDRGRIKHLGLCNTNLNDLEKAKEVAKIEVVQSEYNLFSREVNSIFDYLRQQQISFMSWGTFDKGILSGRVNTVRKFCKTDCRSWAPWWKSEKYKKRVLIGEKLKKYYEEQSIDAVVMALSHNLLRSNQNVVDMTICGMNTLIDMQKIVSSLNLLYSKEIIDETIKKIESWKK